MIDALIAGRIYGAPVERTTKAGKPYCTGKVRVATRDGEGLFVNVIAFAEPAVRALLALSDGDSVALAGELTLKAFAAQDGTPRPAVDVLAHSVLTPYSVQRKRRAPELPFDDDLPGAA